MLLEYHLMRTTARVFFLLVILSLLWLPQVRGTGCSIRFTGASPSSMPQATNPGDLIVKFWFDLTTSDISSTNLGISVSGSNIELISDSISKSSNSGSVYIRIKNSPGAYASLSIRITCQVDGYSDSDTLNLGRSYIVAIPSSWSAGVSPTMISKKGRITLEVSGLGAIDDGVGSLTVSAKLGSHTYSLSRVSRGSFRVYVSINFVNQPAGSKSVKFTVYKYYSGVSARDSKTRSFTVTGSPPEVSASIPPQVHRSDLIKITVSESDGDSVSGSLSAFNKEYNLARGDNVIEVPKDVPAGSYSLHATVKDVDGSSNGSWTTTIVNIPPEVKLSLDKEKVVPSQTVKIDVTAQDDSTGLKVSLSVDGKGVHEEWNLSEDGGVVSYTIPNDFEGELLVKAEAVDIDGATASANAQIEVGRPPVIKGDIPSTIHRGDKYEIEVQGTNVSGSISYMDKKIDVNGEGSYEIEIPNYVKEGEYEIKAYAKNDFGGSSKIWNIFLENVPPKVEISLDSSEVRPGDDIAISVKAMDDSPSVKITLRINDSIYHFEDEGVVHYPVPSDASRLKIVADAIDIDGAKASSSKIVTVHHDQTTSVTTTSSTTSTIIATTTASSESPKIQRTSSGKSEGARSSSRTTFKYKHSGSSASINVTFTPVEKRLMGQSKREVKSYEVGFDVVVIPSNPMLGQNVTVIVTPLGGARGRVWILDPSSRIVKDLLIVNKSVIPISVNSTGNWSVRWAYRDKGGVRFGQLDFTVSSSLSEIKVQAKKSIEKENSEALSRSNSITLIEQKVTRTGKIERFSARCMVYHNEGRDKGSMTPDMTFVLVVVTLLAYLMIRRRLS